MDEIDAFLHKLHSFLCNHAKNPERIPLPEAAASEGMVVTIAVTIGDKDYWLEISEA